MDDDLDALRRRLYSPNVTPEDVARYEAAAGVVEEDPSSTAPRAPAPVRTLRRRAFAVGGVVAVVAGGLAVSRAATRSRLARPTPGPPSASAPSTRTTGVIDARIPTGASVRTELVGRLRAGRTAGVLDLLEADPGLLPPQLLTVGRAASTEYSGTGPTLLRLDPSALAERGGRATVIVVLARTGGYTWAADRRDTLVVAHAASAEAGEPVSSTFAYGPGAPDDLMLLVPDRARWGAVVVFTD